MDKKHNSEIDFCNINNDILESLKKYGFKEKIEKLCDNKGLISLDSDDIALVLNHGQLNSLIDQKIVYSDEKINCLYSNGKNPKIGIIGIGSNQKKTFTSLNVFYNMVSNVQNSFANKSEVDVLICDFNDSTLKENEYRVLGVFVD